MKVLINTRDFKFKGGVVQIFKTLELDKNNNIRYFFFSKPGYSNNPIYLLYKYFQFFFVARDFDIIHLNPSLNKRSIWRDLIFLRIAKLLHKKVILFIHGWDTKYEETIRNNRFLLGLLKTMNQADAIIVLGNIFRNKLFNLHISQKMKIYLESTIADDSYIDPEDIPNKIKTIDLKKKIQFLFISRIVKGKGMILAISIFSILQKKLKSKSISLVIAGDGDMIDIVKDFVKRNNLKNVTFTGYVEKEIKHKLFINSEFLLFPTKYGEGLPNSIVEGCLYGLPIITRDVGGIGDWIQSGRNGFITDRNEPEIFASNIEKIINDPSLYDKISMNNYGMAINSFIPLKVKERLLIYYEKVFNAI